MTRPLIEGIIRTVHPAEGVPLAPLTTLEIGGPARFLADADDVATVAEALRWTRARGIPAAVIGGGSNLVVADTGFDGFILRMRRRGVRVDRAGDVVRLSVGAGEAWDDVVASAAAEGWTGIERLSGIPGTAGATPIQNVGAYGCEIAETLEEVRVFDRETFGEATLSAAACAFGYRDSRFRRAPDRFVVLEVVFRLRVGAAPEIRHAELARALAARRARPGPADVRAAVLELRRAKSMLLDPADENRRSAGSFFLNPVLPPAEADALAARAVAAGAARAASDLPRFETPGGVKVPAAWLVERAGFPKGYRKGPVGVSTRHALALVHHGGGRTADLVALAGEIRRGVRARFGVSLVPEPVFLGFPPGDPLDGGTEEA